MEGGENKKAKKTEDFFLSNRERERERDRERAQERKENERQQQQAIESFSLKEKQDPFPSDCHSFE